MKPAALRRTRDDLFPSGPGLAYVRLVDVPDQTTTTLNAEFLRHRAMIARYLRARGAGESAEDLIQELWMKVAAMPADADVADPASYLFRMAHNLMLDRHRAVLIAISITTWSPISRDRRMIPRRHRIGR
jgi:hypothetical protein